MASRALRPRLALGLQGPSPWRAFMTARSSARFASTESDGSKPIVLEKPLKFNPPSHGSRLKRKTMPKHYGAISSEELAAQRRRSYPGVMAPEGTWSHWFWHNKTLHTVITMGTLLCLAVFTFFMNYAVNSPFKHLLPPTSDIWKQPLTFFSTWRQVILMHEQDKSDRITEMRQAHQSDAIKRRYYMKMHGIETKDPITSVFGKDDAIGKTDEEIEAVALGLETPGGEEKPPKRRKFWGIF